jgi:N-acetylglucosaminyl-diphospho-decaprenol L-rhamnosyltransferase
VVDNATADGGAAMVRQRYPEVEPVVNQVNLGYGVAANQGVVRSHSEYVLLLNSDAVLAPGTLKALSDNLDRKPRVAVVGPRLTHPDGRLQPSRNPFPTLIATFLAECATGPLLRYIPVAGERYLLTSSHASPRRVPWVLGAALAIRRTAFEAVGSFDPSFFMYFEEVDLCYIGS